MKEYRPTNGCNIVENLLKGNSIDGNCPAPAELKNQVHADPPIMQCRPKTGFCNTDCLSEQSLDAVSVNGLSGIPRNRDPNPHRPRNVLAYEIRSPEKDGVRFPPLCVDLSELAVSAQDLQCTQAWRFSGKATVRRLRSVCGDLWSDVWPKLHGRSCWPFARGNRGCSFAFDYAAEKSVSYAKFSLVAVQ